MLHEGEFPQLRIQTRLGRTVPSEASFSLLTGERERIQRELKAQYGLLLTAVEQRQPPSGWYNCHGLTFFGRRAWLTDEEGIRRILEDEAYHGVVASEAMPGDIALYRLPNVEIEHSGIVMRVEKGVVCAPYVLSKWGHAGEFLHRYDQCPYDSDRIAYLREGME